MSLLCFDAVPVLVVEDKSAVAEDHPTNMMDRNGFFVIK